MKRFYNSAQSFITLLCPADDKVWNTACAAIDRNVVMTDSVNNCIRCLWIKCVFM